jgi:hypothetical protein
LISLIHRHAPFVLAKLLLPAEPGAIAAATPNPGVTELILTGAALKEADPAPSFDMPISAPAIVVRLTGPTLAIGADRGESTEVFHASGSFSLFTIRLA